MSFSFLRRLHLSFLLPAVLTTFVILMATINSVVAQQQEEVSSEPKTTLITAPELPAPLAENIMTWHGNIEFDYPAENITATADRAEYYQSEQKVVLTGNVRLSQSGKSQEAETATFFITGKFKISGEENNLPKPKN